MLEKIIDQLEEYFENPNPEFSFGLQNFQGIRQYTTIPLAPLTLLYGQNSAGKSTVHDAIEFIHGFFSGKWNEETVKTYLNRWANQNRNSLPLVKGYLGKYDDVVVSASTIIDSKDFLDWESSHSNIRFSATGLTDLFFNRAQTIPLRLDIHFSNDVDDWYIRQCCVFLWGEVFADFVFDDFLGREEQWDEYGLLRVNKNHPIYDLIDNYYDGGLEAVSIAPYHQDGEEEGWLLFFDMDVNHAATIEKQISWSEVDECLLDRKPTPEIVEFRSFLLALLQIPSVSISKRFNFSLIPPLRLIPSKQSAVFRFRLDPHAPKDGWRLIAEQVLYKFLYDQGGCGFKKAAFSDLERINHWLSDQHCLATGYEITGECFLITPGNLFFDSETSLVQKVEAGKIEYEVHLKLVNKVNNQLIELEDVGVGISQVIPVLLAITTGLDDWSEELKAFIQQPELHLHPKLQAHLADAFIESINAQQSLDNEPCFIVESHSEHFLLRLLRRIRETNSGDNKDKSKSLYSKDTSVLYVDKLADGSSKIFPLRVASDGDFIDRWPNGFFTERDRDLGLLDE